MYIQDQLPGDSLTDDQLSFFQSIGVDYLTLNPVPFSASGDGEKRLETFQEMRDYLLEKREMAERHGLVLNNIALTAIDDISLARPERDMRIDQWTEALRAMAAAGVPTVGYNFKPIGNFRTTSAIGRGGAVYSTFDYEEWQQKTSRADYPDKQIDEDTMWENLQYFLERVLPVAEENGVRLALHPDDPPIAEAMGGAARIVSTLDQYRRIFDLVPSDSNAMLFCQGCVTEMGVDVYQAIRDIGAMNKIVYVHFRNVRGSLKHFDEVFIDEGDVDMFEAMKAYKEIGCEGPFMWDHMPAIPDDKGGGGGRGFVTGYMRAMIQAVYR